MVPTVEFSMTTSLCATSRFTCSRPPSFFTFTPKLRLHRLDEANDALISVSATRRMKSGYVRVSTLITSAPYSANRRPTSTPTPPMPKSSTRRPLERQRRRRSPGEDGGDAAVRLRADLARVFAHAAVRG